MTLWAARLAALRPGPEPLSSAKRRRRRDDLDCLDSGLDCVVGVVDAVCMSAGTVWGAVMGGDNGWSSLSGSLAFVSYGVCSCGLERDIAQPLAHRIHGRIAGLQHPFHLIVRMEVLAIVGVVGRGNVQQTLLESGCIMLLQGDLQPNSLVSMGFMRVVPAYSVIMVSAVYPLFNTFNCLSPSGTDRSFSKTSAVAHEPNARTSDSVLNNIVTHLTTEARE